MFLLRLAGAAAIAAILGVIPAKAADMEFNMSSQWADDNVASQVDRWWASEIEKRTGGEIKVKIFYADALAKSNENLQLVKSGKAALADMSVSYFTVYLPLWSSTAFMPMGLSSVEQESTLLRRLAAEVPALDEEDKRNNLKALFFHNSNPYLLVCKDEVKGLDGLKGKSIRSWGSQMPLTLGAGGAAPMTMGTTEIHDGLSKGLIDCVPLPMDLMASEKIDEVAKHVYDIPLWIGPASGVWINRTLWDKLSPEQRQTIDTVSQEAALKDRDLTIEAAETAKAALKKAGVAFHAFPEADAAKWKAANPDFFKAFIEGQTKARRGDAAKAMVKIWKEVAGG
jgi:TRAP-type C4-dicarboxylate transport system substrate-binding protein